MAVFTYATSQSQESLGSAVISDYADQLISGYSDILIGNLAEPTESSNPFNINSDDIEEEVVYSYNDSSAIYIIDEDFGSINDAPIADITYGSITDLDINAYNSEDYGLISIDETIVPYGSLDISSPDQIVKLIKVDVGQVTFTILGEATIFTTPIEFGKGKITVTGEANPVLINLSHVGSGSLFGFSSATEAVGSNPPESTALFRFVGTVEESVTPAPHIGSGSLFTFVSFTETVSFSQETEGLFRVSGTADQSKTTIYTGSGTLFGIIGSSESTTPAPEIASGLFGFAGEAEEQFFRNNSIVSSGTITLRSETEILITNAFDGEVLLQTAGKVQESFTPAPHTGSGTLFAITGSSESTTVNPPESIALFKISGESTSKLTSSEFSSGQYDLNGSATTLFNLLHVGSGQIEVDGTLEESFTPAPHIGSGTLFAITGSSESTTVDPVDQTTLFTFSGSATENFSNVHQGYVDIDTNGSSITKFNLLHVGSGSLFGFSSATEAVGSNPPESTVLFRFVGTVQESVTPAPHIGSGSLFGFSSTTESNTSSERSKGLFRVIGGAVEKNTESYVGSGSLFGFSSTTESTSSVEVIDGLFKITGRAIEKNTESYVGSGSLFGFSSTTESATSSERSKGLFRVIGGAVEKNTESYVGSGSLFGISGATESTSSVEVIDGLFKITGRAIEKNTESYVGSGSLFTFVSFTESATSSERSKGLFRVIGGAVEKNTESYVGSGSIFTFVSVTETRTISEVSVGRFRFAGSAVEKNTESYVGSGSLFGITGASESVSPAPEIASGLFKFVGAATESITPAPHVGSGSIFTFISFTETFAVSPDDTRVLFEFSGAASNIKKTDSYLGTGSLFGITGSFESITPAPEVVFALFRIIGRAFESFGYPNYDGLGISQLEGTSTTTKVEFEPAKPTRIIII